MYSAADRSPQFIDSTATLRHYRYWHHPAPVAPAPQPPPPPPPLRPAARPRASGHTTQPPTDSPPQALRRRRPNSYLRPYWDPQAELPPPRPFLHAHTMRWFALVATVAFLLYMSGAAAQGYDGSDFAATCDMSTLFSRASSLSSVCCTIGGEQCDELQPCTTECLGVLLPLLDNCRDVMNRLFDANDGVEDGQDQTISEAYDQCAAIPPATLIEELKTLQDRGQCPPTVLDGVAATEVKAPGCVDRWAGDRCALSIASGIMTCEDDFCNTVYPPCDMAGHCDSSCNLCEDDGSGHRLLVALLQQLRRLQMAHLTCSPSNFEASAAAVDVACCDDDGQSCTDGLPTDCDAKCAVVFNSFYTRCQRFMGSQLGLSQMAGYDQLFSTCTRALPAEPLLRALVVCSANPPDPCFEVDCGEDGSCDGGSCQCEQGYSGETCDVFDPCAGVDCGGHGLCGVDCGGHGQCVGGICQCEDGWEGTECEQNARGRFQVMTGPCTTSADSTCVGRPTGYDSNEVCRIVVSRAGTLGTCPLWDVAHADTYSNAVHVDGNPGLSLPRGRHGDWLYTPGAAYGGPGGGGFGHCPDGVAFNVRDELYWTSSSSIEGSGWQICFAG
eukprot:SAG31_NODE_176_length_21334_cov_12.211067_25_plen_612_part_00